MWIEQEHMHGRIAEEWQDWAPKGVRINISGLQFQDRGRFYLVQQALVLKGVVLCWQAYTMKSRPFWNWLVMRTTQKAA